MGHYASEIDPDWNPGEGLPKWYGKGYRLHLGDEHLECPHCGALVAEEQWMKHETFHHPPKLVGPNPYDLPSVRRRKK